MIENYSLYKKAQNKRKLIRLSIMIFLIVIFSVGFEIYFKLSEEKTIRKEEIKELLAEINPEINTDFLNKKFSNRIKFQEDSLESFPLYIIEESKDDYQENLQVRVINQQENNQIILGNEATLEGELREDHIVE